MDDLALLHADVTACRACPRLVAWREEVAAVKRRAYRDWDYWGQPVPGFGDARNQPCVEVDRAAAIQWALQHARPGDCVLVAGKGHETEQIIGTERIPFDDRDCIRGKLQDFEQQANPQQLRLRA